MEPSLSQGVGYGVIIGGSIFFCILMNLVSLIQNKFTNISTKRVDEFNSGSRNIPFGLILCGIVSSWTWSLTLLQAPTESYNLGFSGSYWYAIGGLLQVSVFSVISSKIKKNANLVTTFPEMAYFRFGAGGHLSFLWCGLTCNAIISSCILLGGSAVISAITGINEYVALFIIPIGVACYVSFGGLRATFISDAIHTFVLLIFIIVFVIEVYFKGSKIGSPQKMYDLLQNLPPVDGNYQGSYLTFRSSNAGIFSIISIITGFGLVVNDQAYLSRAIASDPKSTSASYFYGAGAWFVIPFAMGASLGLAGKALSNFSDFPALTADEVSAGLVSVASVTYLMGKNGAAMILIMVFFSVTSSFSGELIATSTLLSYDVYKRYINKSASNETIMKAAKISVFIWAIFAGVLASIFKGAAKISMGWLFNFLGVATASGVFPIALSFTWKDLNREGAIGGSIGGMVIAFIVWLITCKAYMGEINVKNLSQEWVSFAGNATALVMGGVISVSVSLLKPSDFDFEQTRNRSILNISNKTINNGNSQKDHKKKDVVIDLAYELSDNYEIELSETIVKMEEINHTDLDRQYHKYSILVIIVALIAAIIIPVPLSAVPYVFSSKFLTAWVIIIIIWLFYSLTLVILYPIFESGKVIYEILEKLVKAIIRKG